LEWESVFSYQQSGRIYESQPVGLEDFSAVAARGCWQEADMFGSGCMLWRNRKIFPELGALMAFVALALAGPSPARGAGKADSRRLIWTMKVAQILKEPDGWEMGKGHETEAVAFSPDDKHIALTVAHKQHAPSGKLLSNTHLFIVDVQSGESGVRQFDIEDSCGVDLAWNDTGSALLVCGRLVRLSDGARCVVSPSPQSLARHYSTGVAFWLDSEHVVRSTGQVLDLSCRGAGKWPLEPKWFILAGAASKGWILSWHSEGRRPNDTCAYSIGDKSSDTQLTGWPIQQSPCGLHPTLAIGARALCYNVGAFPDAKLHCRAVMGGGELRVPLEAQGYQLTDASALSGLVVADKWGYDQPWWGFVFSWVPSPGPPALPQKRTVIDLLSGNVVSSWTPKIQHSTSSSVEDWPYHCGLSGSGELLAESGDGTVDLYRFP
jgi:hypothetical protein